MFGREEAKGVVGGYGCTVLYVLLPTRVWKRDQSYEIGPDREVLEGWLCVYSTLDSCTYSTVGSWELLLAVHGRSAINGSVRANRMDRKRPSREAKAEIAQGFCGALLGSYHAWCQA